MVQGKIALLPLYVWKGHPKKRTLTIPSPKWEEVIPPMDKR